MTATPKKQRNTLKKLTFIQNVKEVLELLYKPNVDIKEIHMAVEKFNNQMDNVREELKKSIGLDMTEEEQLQKIQDLEKSIELKKKLIEECRKCYESWGASPSDSIPPPPSV